MSIIKNIQNEKIQSNKSQIKFVKITYEPELQSDILEFLQQFVNQYPIVTIHYENQLPIDKQEIQNDMEKRDIYYLFPSKSLQKDDKFDKWLHYSNKKNQVQDQKQTIYIQQNVKVQQISHKYKEQNNQVKKKIILKQLQEQKIKKYRKIIKDTTENLKLGCLWIGVCSRIGSQVQVFCQYLQQKQNFNSYQISHLYSFLNYLNENLKKYSSQDNQYLFQKSFNLTLQKDIPNIQKKLQKQICQNFNQRILLVNITNHRYLQFLRTRNYFQLIGIEETLKNRFKNFQIIVKNLYPSILSWLDFQNFIELDQYWYAMTIQKAMKKVSFTINRLHKPIKKYSQIIQQNKNQILKQFRPTFDSYFISICKVLKERAGCIKQAVGAIIVRNKRIISTGYNGTPMGSPNCFNGACRICNNSQKMNTVVLSCNCIHAQYGCIIEAGIHVTPGCILYTTRFPCLWCAKMIIQAKIKEVVYLQSISQSLEFQNSDKIRKMFSQTSIKLTEFPNKNKEFSD